MTRTATRCVTTGLTALALCVVTGGIAQADPSSVWVVPGVDAGPVLGPVVQLPTQALQPVFSVLGAFGG